ncbi:MAG: hypothetical protein UX92_C0003G0022 [Candidatus Amesbacteria bacterium GW2011_GWA1_47_20]|uniref:Uncharacterized protein n=2 Tax=Candidatus Amesiibacteriota TaxID=1752730 RepID=A0A0G1SL86_9BACT|nr:MAG: hypothetical protein UX42_C0014G0023 [Microgenomates group bacterium GW2011_GWC1_46_20]KKU70202.1 MAG: hypothetical protein UX92_C0003G0022 [Candidatus Amesbacteria bacterium GW2011_GWA1_47_20]KKU83120.1 MAG: hypothetical protein UY11_C0028G0014 [Candidatus Amesbacteria bacterium GW2011_GWC2_47_8]
MRPESIWEKLGINPRSSRGRFLVWAPAALVGLALEVRELSKAIMRGEALVPEVEVTERMEENVAVEGANLLEVLGQKWSIGINKQALLEMALKVSEIEGGPALAGKVGKWLEQNKWRVFISPLQGGLISSIFGYPYLDVGSLEANEMIVVKAREKVMGEALEVPESLIDGKSGYVLARYGVFFHPVDTVDDVPAVMINAGVVWFAFLQKCLDGKVGEFPAVLLSETGHLLKWGEDTLAHELWHMVRWINNPEREDYLASDGAGGYKVMPVKERDLVEDAGWEYAESTAAAFLGALTGKAASRGDGNNLKRLARGIATFLVSKQLLDPVHEPYARTGHPERERSRVEDAFAKDLHAKELFSNVFTFRRV